MFALEIVFADVSIPSETILIRRPSALIGGQEYAHVAIDDLADLPFQLRIVRQLGRDFEVIPVGSGADQAQIGGRFSGDANIDLGPVTLIITSLDLDCCLFENEAPDRAGVRILRESFSSRPPVFPALVTKGPHPIVLSFTKRMAVSMGRSRECQLRVDSPDVSSQHARIGVLEENFWIEDLGSTNGTFIGEQQIYGRQKLRPGQSVTLGGDFTLVAVQSQEQLDEFWSSEESVTPEPDDNTYPILVSASEVVRPSRSVLKPGEVINLGRDPSSDVWLAAPHISRRHCSISVSTQRDEVAASEGSEVSFLISVRDFSTNGISFDGGEVLKGETVKFEGTSPAVIDFGGGITLGVCFDKMQEQLFLEARGSAFAFAGADSPQRIGARTETDLTRGRDGDLQQEGKERLSTKRKATVQRAAQRNSKGMRVSRPLVMSVLLMLLVIAAVVFNLVSGIFG